MTGNPRADSTSRKRSTTCQFPQPASQRNAQRRPPALPPIVSKGFLIQDEICAASARVTTDLTASAARRGYDTVNSWLDLSAASTTVMRSRSFRTTLRASWSSIPGRRRGYARPGQERCRAPPNCIVTPPPVRLARLKRRLSCEPRGLPGRSQDEHGAWGTLHDMVHDRAEDSVEHVVSVRGNHNEIGGDLLRDGDDDLRRVARADVYQSRSVGRPQSFRKSALGGGHHIDRPIVRRGRQGRPSTA